jgi:hypothetical protein
MFNLVPKIVRNGNGSYRAMVLNTITSNPKLIKYKENFIAIDENPRVVKILDKIKKKQKLLDEKYQRSEKSLKLQV